MKSFTALCVLAVVCSAFGAPEQLKNHALLESSPRDTDLIANTRKLIEDLVGNLHKSAQEALEAVHIFKAGIKHEVDEIKNKIENDIQKFRSRITGAVESVMNRVSNTSVAVKECVDSHRGAAAAVFNETLSGALACVDDRVADVTEQIEHLMTISEDAIAGGAKALKDMKNCTAANTNLLAAGSCLGVVAVQTEIKLVGFIGQSAMTIGRINLAISTLPASLEVCAGMSLIQTGIATGKIIVEIGSCSASGIFNTIIGKRQA